MGGLRFGPMENTYRVSLYNLREVIFFHEGRLRKYIEFELEPVSNTTVQCIVP
jgi:hypothetical protein